MLEWPGSLTNWDRRPEACGLILLVAYCRVLRFKREDKSVCLSHHGVDPVCWGVFGVLDSQLNDALPLKQTRAGAHGKTSHLLHARDEEIHPAQTTTTHNQWFNPSKDQLGIYLDGLWSNKRLWTSFIKYFSSEVDNKNMFNWTRPCFKLQPCTYLTNCIFNMRGLPVITKGVYLFCKKEKKRKLQSFYSRHFSTWRLSWMWKQLIFLLIRVNKGSLVPFDLSEGSTCSRKSNKTKPDGKLTARLNKGQCPSLTPNMEGSVYQGGRQRTPRGEQQCWAVGLILHQHNDPLLH